MGDAKFVTKKGREGAGQAPILSKIIPIKIIIMVVEVVKNHEYLRCRCSSVLGEHIAYRVAGFHKL